MDTEAFHRWLELKETHDELNKQVAAVKKEMAALEPDMLDDLFDVDSLVVGGRRFAREEQVVPGDIQWDDVHNWVKENDGLYILQRRLSLTSWREELEAGNIIPGTSPTTITKLKTGVVK